MLKKMSKKISLLLVLVLVFSVVLTGCGAKKDGVKSVADIQKSGKIVLGTDPDYPPFEFVIKDEIVGFDIEIAKYIAESLGVELEISSMDFDNLVSALGSGRIDMAIAGMNPDPDRDANFTDVYYESNLAVVVKKDNPHNISKEEDLKDKIIGVQIGTTQEGIANKANGKEVVSLADNNDLIMNLKTNKIDCAIMEVPVANTFAGKNDDLMVVEGLEIYSGTDGVAIALKTGSDELTEKINEILTEIKSKGLIEKWFAEAEELSKQEE